jgi:hypothetical protein
MDVQKPLLSFNRALARVSHHQFKVSRGRSTFHEALDMRINHSYVRSASDIHPGFGG